MKSIFFIFCIFLFQNAHSQVGINTSKPKAQLDINANSPESPLVTDGLLIPRVSKFPTLNPSTDQNGMMLYLTVTYNNFPPGFYYWNNMNVKWENIGSTNSGNFYKATTTTYSSNPSESIYRTGNVGIGITDPLAKLQIYLNSLTDAAVKKAFEVDNNNPTVDNLTSYAIVSDNRSATNGNKYGIKNNVGGLGTGIHYGIFNETYQSASTNEVYGIFNRVGRTFGATKKHYGIYNEIGSDQGQGIIYGIYSSAIGNTSAKVYAGYFAGKVGIGLTPEEEYILPASRGKDEQILVSDNTGNVTWSYNNTKNYSTTGGNTGDFLITDEIYSLRINNTISSITLPPANLHKGRILVLIGWDGTGSKALNFMNSEDLYDVISNSKITAITGNQILMIQSAGNRWIVLNNYKKTP